MSKYDLTGEDPRFKVRVHPEYLIFNHPDGKFPIDLPSPAYMQHISVFQSDVEPEVKLDYGVDWEYDLKDVDYKTMSMIKYTHSSFGDTLLKSIKIIKEPSPEFKVRVEYQAVSLSDLGNNIAYQEAEEVNLSPQLIKELSDKIAYVSGLKDPIQDLVSTTEASRSVLTKDLTGQLEENYIRGEEHVIDVPNQKALIVPANGSFYNKDIRIVVVETGLPLEEDQYKVIELDAPATMECADPAGVFKVILIKANVVGNVKIDYRAFGGQVTTNTVQQLLAIQLNIIGFLKTASITTPENLAKSEPFQELNNKIKKVEDWMRILQTDGTATYRDRTHSKAYKYRFNFPTPAKHWFTIASLYKVPDSDDVFTRDQLRFKFESAYSGMLMTATLSIDLSNADNPLTVDIQSDNSKDRYKEYNDYIDTEKIIIPEFRMLWNSDVATETGCVIQIGFNSKHLVQEIMGIEDMSGWDSCVMLKQPPNDAIGPQNDNVELPSGSLWVASSPVHRVATATPTPYRGVLAWAGIKSVRSLAVAEELFNTLQTPDDYDLDNLDEVEFHIYDRIDDKFFTASAKISKMDGAYTGTVLFYPEDLCQISVSINDTTTPVKRNVRVEANIGRWSNSNNNFMLRQLVLKFK